MNKESAYKVHILKPKITHKPHHNTLQYNTVGLAITQIHLGSWSIKTSISIFNFVNYAFYKKYWYVFPFCFYNLIAQIEDSGYMPSYAVPCACNTGLLLSVLLLAGCSRRTGVTSCVYVYKFFNFSGFIKLVFKYVYSVERKLLKEGWMYEFFFNLNHAKRFNCLKSRQKWPFWPNLSL